MSGPQPDADRGLQGALEKTMRAEGSHAAKVEDYGLAFGFHEQGVPMTRAEFRPVFTGPLIGNCGYTQETAEAALAPAFSVIRDTRERVPPSES